MELFNTLVLLGAILQPVLSNSVDIYPNSVNTGASIAQFTSGSEALDGPKVNSLNGTSYDWWYFDAVSSTTNASIVFVFYIGTDGGFPFLQPGSGLSLNIFATFENGTTGFYAVNNAAGTAGEAVIVTDGQGATGYWNSTGAQWVGSPRLTNYVVTVDSPTLGIQGTLTLQSITPPHYPCGPVESGANLEVSPNIGWANAIPDADAVANFKIGGTSLQFTGVGYHDKNWGVQPFAANVESWYWGHGRLGPYSIVWFDIIGADGDEYVSSYAALNGVIVASACSGIKVRPTGNNSQYPPLISTGNPEGFHIDLNLPEEEVLCVDVTTNLIVLDGAPYARYTGTLHGQVNGSSTSYTGVALYEEFKFLT